MASADKVFMKEDKTVKDMNQDSKHEKAEKTSTATVILDTVLTIPFRIQSIVYTTIHMFLLSPKFRVHRLTGMTYLIMFTMACAAEFYPPILEAFPHLHIAMPITGCAQACIAALTFKFLGKNSAVQGYFSDKRTLSYDFVCENIFFAGLLAFQALYLYQKWIFTWFPPLEVLLVFFPYLTIRKAFPRTRLRDSINNDKEKTDANRRFLIIQTWTSKVFMIFGKHMSGYMINYLIFLDAIPSHHMRTMRFQFILGGWGTTIAVFLHTLKFKGYIGPRVAVLAYTGVFPVFYILYLSLFDLMYAQATITVMALVGIYVNFKSVYLQAAYQAGVYLYLRHLRMTNMA